MACSFDGVARDYVEGLDDRAVVCPTSVLPSRLRATGTAREVPAVGLLASRSKHPYGASSLISGGGNA